MSGKYVVVSDGFFGVLVAVQVTRALNRWLVVVAGHEIPVWFSWLVAVIAGSLCAWAFRSGQK